MVLDCQEPKSLFDFGLNQKRSSVEGMAKLSTWLNALLELNAPTCRAEK